MSGVLLTSVVGSYPQPDWLIDRERLGERLPPRVRARELWRVEESFLEEAQDDATRVAVRDMERAGVDVITDGEMRRESYSNRFATALDGVDLDEPGVALDRTGHENPVPRVVGPIRRTRPVEVRDVEFLRSITDRRIKITVPGPFTMTQQAQNDYYDDDRSLALAYAEAVNEELRDLKAAGADVVQIDEPYLQARPASAREYAVEAINRALEGIEGETVLHTCFGYAHIVHDRLPGYPFLRELADCRATHLSLEAAQPNLDPQVLRDLPDKTIVLGVLDLGSSTVETPQVVADRIRRALTVLPPERLVLAPDCGMKYLSRETAFRKLEAMVAGAHIVREELQRAGRSPAAAGIAPLSGSTREASRSRRRGFARGEAAPCHSPKRAVSPWRRGARGSSRSSRSPSARLAPARRPRRRSAERCFPALRRFDVIVRTDAGANAASVRAASTRPNALPGPSLRSDRVPVRSPRACCPDSPTERVRRSRTPWASRRRCRRSRRACRVESGAVLQPGAASSTLAPSFDQEYSLSPSSVAATLITPG